MGSVLVFNGPRVVAFDAYIERELESKEVWLRTLYSEISAGTELTAYRGSNPYLHKRWDPNSRLFVTAKTASQSYPLSGWGYEEVGEVVELGSEVTGIEVGDIIYGTWGHRTHHTININEAYAQNINEAYAQQRKLPATLDVRLGIFSQIAAIALNGVHDARIRIGETVAVFGLGVPGQIVAQLAKRSGAHVIGVDLVEKRLVLAKELGAVDVAVNPSDGPAGEQIKAWTAGRGADVSLEVSGSTAALHEAIRATAYSGKVIALGFYQGEAQGLFLGEEFHHNRVNVVCSQISGVDPELTYRWNALRLVQTGMRLQEEGLLDLKPLITHEYPFEEAAEAFRVLDEEAKEALQVVLNFEDERAVAR